MSDTDDRVAAALDRIEPDYRAVADLGPVALPSLVERARSTDPATASRAVYAAGAIAEKVAAAQDGESLEAIAAITELAAVSSEVLVRLSAASAAHALPPHLAARTQVPLLADEDAGVRMTAIEMAPSALPSELRTAVQAVAEQATENVVVRDMARELGQHHPRI